MAIIHHIYQVIDKIIYSFSCLILTFYHGLASTESHQEHHNLHLFFHVIENILKYTSLTILAFFVLEVIVKLIFSPKVFIESKFEIFDAFVVVISFGVNTFLLFNKHLVMSVGGLLTLLRLWRITEIVNGKSFFQN